MSPGRTGEQTPPPSSLPLSAETGTTRPGTFAVCRSCRREPPGSASFGCQASAGDFWVSVLVEALFLALLAQGLLLMRVVEEVSIDLYTDRWSCWSDRVAPSEYRLLWPRAHRGRVYRVEGTGDRDCLCGGRLCPLLLALTRESRPLPFPPVPFTCLVHLPLFYLLPALQIPFSLFSFSSRRDCRPSRQLGRRCRIALSPFLFLFPFPCSVSHSSQF